MYGYYFDSSYFIYMIISVVVSLYAHLKVKSAFNKYSRVPNSRAVTGSDAAKRVLSFNKVEGVSVGRTRGYFTDYFDSRNKTISLSDNVYDKSTVASVGVAAHESGHAVQDYVGYFPLKIRHMLIPITQIGSNLAFPLVFVGLMLPVRYSFIVNLGIILFSAAVLFQLVTLPVEFDASRRALQTLKDANILTPEELHGAKKVLTAAALTYVAATFTALLSLLRLIFIAGRRRD